MTTEKAVINTSRRDRTACSTCTTFKADNLRHALARLSGVSKVKVDGLSGKITVEYDDQRICLSKITERIEKLGYQAKTVSREYIL